MDDVSSKAIGDAVFPAGVSDPEGLVELGADAWFLVRLAADGGCRLETMRLVRWRDLHLFLGERWAAKGAEIVATIRSEIQRRLGPEGHCIRYDDFSYLIACPGASGPFADTPENDFIASLTAKLAGTLGADTPIELWTPVSVEKDGFRFARANAEPDSRVAMETAAAIAPGPPPAPETSPTQTMILGDAEFRHSPLWDVRGNEVFCYLFEPLWDLGDGEALSEDALEEQFRDPKRTLALDLETLAKATDELERGLDQYRLVKFLIPVHYRTLADPAACETYLRFCNRKIWSVREFAYFEIVKPPPLPMDGLGPAARQIEPFAAGVMVRVGQGFDAFAEVPGDDIFSIGMDFSRDDRPEGAVIAELEHLAAGSGAQGLHSHVHGLTEMNFSVAAACAGIDFIGSDAIAQDLDEWVAEESMPKPLELFKSLLAAANARKGKA